jgi:hypothetical protein
MALGKDSVQIAVIIKKDLRDALKAYAELHHWSMSQAAAILISRGIDNWRDGFDKPESTKDA